MSLSLSTIPITVLRCNYDDDNHMKYLFQIFHRLNSGGNKLYNQEIRNCIYQGSFNTLLKNLARENEWLKFADTDIEKVEKSRFNNEERILRFLAFYDDYESYCGKLAVFLNNYMYKYKNLDETQIISYKELVLRTLSIANEMNIKVTSKNVADALLVGIAKNIKTLKDCSSKDIIGKYNILISQPEFSNDALQEGLGATEKVKGRIKKAIEVFGND